MAKSKAKKKVSSEREPPAPDPLRPGLEAFGHGDYAQARERLNAQAQSPDRTESERRMAERVVAATWLERGTLLAGLACIGLYALVLLVSFAKQP